VLDVVVVVDSEAVLGMLAPENGVDKCAVLGRVSWLLDELDTIE